MKKRVIVLIVIILAVIVLLGIFLRYNPFNNNPGAAGQQDKSGPKSANQLSINKQTTMKITSPAFLAGQSIPSRFTCDGQNINPALTFEQVPREAKSLALIMDDPDAPAGTFTHWLVWNLPVGSGIATNNLPPEAISGLNDGGQLEYFGPCPPNGKHRYFFKLFALDYKIKLPSGATRAQLEKALAGHTLGETYLMGTYSR